MRNLKLLSVFGQASNLVEIRISWQIKYNFIRIFGEALVQLIHIVWIHLCEVKDILVTIFHTFRDINVRHICSNVFRLTSPRWARKNYYILVSSKSIDSIEAVTTQPENLA